MQRLIALILLTVLAACHAAPSTPDVSVRDAGAHDAAPDAKSPAPVPVPVPHAMGDGGHHVFGALLREYAFIPDAGMAITTYDDPNTGRQDVFFQATAAVSAVTGSSGVACSPTTGAVNCTNTGATSVTGAGTVSCSPTTGAVTCTGTNAVSSVTGTSGVSCSPTTGAVSCSNTGVTSLAAGSGISLSGSTGPITITNTGASSVTSVTGSSGVTCSPTTGSVVCSVAAPIGVGNGGTGVTSCAAGDYVSGNGSSPLICTHLTQHQVALGEGTFPPGGAGPGTSGQVLTSNGASADPSFQAPVTQLGGFIDYTTNTLSGLTTSLQTVTSVAESITFPRPVIVDVSWICTDGLENNGILVGVNVDNNTSIPTAYQLAGGFGAAPTGTGAASNGTVFMSQHVYFGGLSTASHTFYFMAATSLTSIYAAVCTAQAVIHF